MHDLQRELLTEHHKSQLGSNNGRHEKMLPGRLHAITAKSAMSLQQVTLANEDTPNGPRRNVDHHAECRLLRMGCS